MASSTTALYWARFAWMSTTKIRGVPDFQARTNTCHTQLLPYVFSIPATNIASEFRSKTDCWTSKAKAASENDGWLLGRAAGPAEQPQAPRPSSTFRRRTIRPRARRVPNSSSRTAQSPDHPFCAPVIHVNGPETKCEVRGSIQERRQLWIVEFRHCGANRTTARFRPADYRPGQIDRRAGGWNRRAR